jgi:hypothetical protein
LNCIGGNQRQESAGTDAQLHFLEKFTPALPGGAHVLLHDIVVGADRGDEDEADLKTLPL